MFDSSRRAALQFLTNLILNAVEIGVPRRFCPTIGLLNHWLRREQPPYGWRNSDFVARSAFFPLTFVCGVCVPIIGSVDSHGSYPFAPFCLLSVKNPTRQITTTSKLQISHSRGCHRRPGGGAWAALGAFAFEGPWVYTQEPPKGVVGSDVSYGADQQSSAEQGLSCADPGLSWQEPEMWFGE